MSEWLSGISISCFTASYAITLGLEVSRLFLRVPVRWPIKIGFAAAGLFAHTAYLWTLARREAESATATPLSSWYDWCLLAAWIVVAAYLGLTLRRPLNAVGLFLLPLVMALIGAAAFLQDVAPFPRSEAANYWGLMHGIILLLGTVGVMLASAAGVMYLVQSYRLKHQLPSRQGFNLPSLEWLQRFNREALLVSTCLLAIGMVAGIVLNLIQHMQDTQTVEWTDRGVLISVGSFLWLAGVTLFEQLYKPAQQGRKVAYLTLASFLFLGFAVIALIRAEHGSGRQTRAPAPRSPLAVVSSHPGRTNA